MCKLNYYLGPWQWRTDDTGSYWVAPKGVVGLVDLRPLAACGATVSHEYNFGFFASEDTLDSSYISLGTDLEALLTIVQRDAWYQTLGLPSITGHKLLDVFTKTLTLRPDPEQNRRVQGLRPGQDRRYKLTLAGQTVWQRQFAGLTDPAWPMLKPALHADFRKNFEIDQASLIGDAEAHRRLLTDWMGKYGIADWQELVPVDLLKDVEGPLPKHTTTGDTFVDTTAVELAAHTATGPNGGGSWTEVNGDWEIWTANDCSRRNYVGGGVPCARYDVNLSSDDHYAQIDVAALYHVNATFGAAVRLDTGGAIDCYICCARSRVAPDGLRELVKYVAGTPTVLSSDTVSEAVTFVMKTSADGSTIKGYVDGAEIFSETDATLSGDLRCGLINNSGVDNRGGTLDNFVAADLGAPAATTPNCNLLALLGVA